MEKKQAEKQIQDVFQNPFRIDSFKYFIRNLLNDYEAKENKYYKNARLWDKFWPHINFYERIGKYIDPNGDELDILVVEVPYFAKLERARSTLRSLVVKHLTKFGEKNYALAAFYAKEDNGADWRFSFIKIEDTSELVDGKVKIRTDFTPAKRCSFLVGEHENSHTAQNQLLDLLAMDYANPTIEQIETAFSIEKVTNEFFEQYKALFKNLSRQLQSQPLFQKDSEDESSHAVARFAKKLLGQIVFLYFLQKKGWLGVEQEDNWGTGNKRFLSSLFEKAQDKGANFYNDCLQYLFYEALAEERKNQPDPAYYELFECKIPFLNGGLFEAEYDWRQQKIDLPDSLFRNQEKNRAGDTGTGILNVFDRYNFTIKEDEPLEKEVAVDPEMLGKVFENMLDTTERKSKGAFYTPREIVHYMCQESLIHYLDNNLNSSATSYQEFGSPQTSLFGNGYKKGQLKLTEEQYDIKVPKADLELLIRKGHLALENDQRVIGKGKETDTYKFQHPESVRKHAGLIDDKLAAIKICDPAIGSGAFPVGLLHEIVGARLALQPHTRTELTAYDLKRHAIQESIYGVDIDPSAIDIARLRLWLSLIVDEDDYDNIKALPNLDYKIMQGNSLISEFMGLNFDEDEPKKNMTLFAGRMDRHVEKLKEKKDLFQKKTGKDEKDKLRQEIDDLIIEIFENRLKKQKKDLVQKLKTIEEKYASVPNQKKRDEHIAQEKRKVYTSSGIDLEKLETQLREFTSGRKVKPFFLWKLYFAEIFQGEKNGFDVVIGNPPYVRADRSVEHLALRKAILGSKQYETLWEKWDLYVPFIEKGYKLLSNGGLTTMIVSDAYCHSKYAQKSQKFFLKTCRILRLDFFSKIQLFDAGVRNITYFFQKADGSRNKPERRVHELAFGNVTYLATDEQRNLDYRVFFPEENKAKQVTVDAVSLSEICYISYGLRPNSDEKEKDNKFITADLLSDSKDEIHSRPYVDGKHLDRWLPATNIWIEWGTERAPGLFCRPTFKEMYEVPEKILAQRSPGPDPKACYDKKQLIFTPSSVGFINWHLLKGILNRSIRKSARYQNEKTARTETPNREKLEKLSKKFAVKYLLAVMNSSVARNLLRDHRRSNIHLYPNDWKQLLVPNITKTSQLPFEILVDYILSLKGKDLKLQTAYFEQLIDAMVFELYFPEELKAASKEIIKHLGELKPVTDNMTDEEKMVVIQREFDRLYDPNHPVRNNLETLDSVEEVRIIKEALA